MTLCLSADERDIAEALAAADLYLPAFILAVFADRIDAEGYLYEDVQHATAGERAALRRYCEATLKALDAAEADQ